MSLLERKTKQYIGINRCDMLAHLKCIVCDSNHLITYASLTEEQVTERLSYISEITNLPIYHTVTHLINLVIDDLENGIVYVGDYGLPSIKHNFSRHDNLVQKMDEALGTDTCLIFETDKNAKVISNLALKNTSDVTSQDFVIVPSTVFKKTDSLFILLEIAYSNLYNFIISFYIKSLNAKKYCNM